MTQRTCPECGRVVETRVNRLKIETWPNHHVVSLSQTRGTERVRVWQENSTRPPGNCDWEIQCPMSGCPV